MRVQQIKDIFEASETKQRGLSNTRNELANELVANSII